ncbi:hypothetical protein Aduo_015208 [Ancylostoma duodenale]
MVPLSYLKRRVLMDKVHSTVKALRLGYVTEFVDVVDTASGRTTTPVVRARTPGNGHEVVGFMCVHMNVMPLLAPCTKGKYFRPRGFTCAHQNVAGEEI